MPTDFSRIRRARHLLLAAAILIVCLQGLVAFSLTMTEYLPSPPPLDRFPDTFNRWRAAQESPMDPDALEMLAPDDYLNRVYFDPSKDSELGLFIAYYKSQHRAKGAHDPKVCLPGSGWNPVSSTVIQLPLAAATIPANRFVVSNGALTDVVVYWYQMERRALTGSEGLHLRRILETFGENRTDMALVRIVVPVKNGDLSTATAYALDFARAAYPSIMRQFPPRTTVR